MVTRLTGMNSAATARTRTPTSRRRAEAGRDPHDKSIQDLVGELSTRSDVFRQLWGAHDVRSHGAGVKRFHHPVVGDLTLAYEELAITADPSSVLIIYTAEPGSPTAERLRLLASCAATQHPEVAITVEGHVLIVEVIRHRYRVDSQDAKATVIQTLRDKLSRNPGKKLALAYLDDFEGKFWAETDERVREITSTLTQRIGGEATVGAGVPSLADASMSTSAGAEKSESSRVELTQRYQRIINEIQLARLNKMMDVLDEDILNSPQDFTYIIIDDLDKDWVDAKLTNELIMALFKTVHDLKRVRNLKVLVALRSNIFKHLEFDAIGGGQEEKFRSLVLPMNWTREQLTNVMDERIKIAGRRQLAEVETVSAILPHQNVRRGSALDYLLDRTLLRPRDFIAFVRECLTQSEGKSQISWDAIHRAEITYSENRLLALRDEWKSNYPGIDRVFETFRHADGRMTREDMQQRLDDCILLLAEDGFTGAGWLTPLGNAVLDGVKEQSWAKRYGPILRMLYDIGFLGISIGTRRVPVFSTDDPNALRYDRQVEAVDGFVVARAYHSALEVQTAGQRTGSNAPASSS